MAPLALCLLSISLRQNKRASRGQVHEQLMDREREQRHLVNLLSLYLLLELWAFLYRIIKALKHVSIHIQLKM